MQNKKILVTGLSILAAAGIAGSLWAAKENTCSKNNQDHKALQIQTAAPDNTSTCPAGKQCISPFDVMQAQMTHMQKQMDQMFNNPFPNSFFRQPNGQRQFYGSKFASPRVKMSESKTGYTVQVVTPGMDKSDLKVQISNNILTVSGNYSQESKESDNKKVVSKSRVTSEFTQSFTLPEDSEPAKVTSSYKNGILTIEIPKDMKKSQNNIQTVTIQ